MVVDRLDGCLDTMDLEVVVRWDREEAMAVSSWLGSSPSSLTAFKDRTAGFLKDFTLGTDT